MKKKLKDLKIEQWDIDDVKLYDKNPRINDVAVDKTAMSIKEYGWKQPIVVDADGVVVVGHTRLKAARKLGYNKVPVIVADDLTPAQIKAYRIADNRTGEISTWDDDLLNLEIKDLMDMNFNIELTGFDIDDFEFLRDEGYSGLIDEDDVPEAPEAPTTKIGDLWILGEHRLLCGDATNKEDIERLMDGKKADMVFTDPPYGINFEYNEYKDKKGKEYLIFCDKWFDSLLSLNPKYMAISTGWKYQKYWWSKNPKDVMYWFAKNKKTGGTIFHFRRIEPIFVWGEPFKKYDFDFFEQTIKIEKDLKGKHTCPKPVGLILSIIEKGVKIKKIVVDTFLGSGTTLIACEKTERICYGMEIDPHYCDVIINRWENFTGRKAILTQHYGS